MVLLIFVSNFFILKNCLPEVFQAESIRVTPQGNMAFLIAGESRKIYIMNVESGKKKELLIERDPLFVLSIDEGSQRCLAIFKSGEIMLYQLDGTQKALIDLSSIGLATVAGSLSRSNSIFFVGLIHWNEEKKMGMTYKVFSLRGDTIMEIGSFNRDVIGILVRFRENLWLMTQDHCEKLPFLFEMNVRANQ